MSDENGTDIRDWLANVDTPRSRLVVDDLVQLGRSRARRRRHLNASGTAAVVLLLAAAVPLSSQVMAPDEPAAPADWPTHVVECLPTPLPLPDQLADPQTSVRMWDMDPTGRYLIGRVHPSDSDVPTAAILWADGQPTVIPPPDGFQVIRASAVNAHGMVVGTASEQEDGDRRAWTYYDGAFTELSVPPGDSIEWVSDINAVGDVVGVVRSAGRHYLTTWWAGDPAGALVDDPPVRSLPDGMLEPGMSASGAPLAGYPGQARIGDDGTVVGESAGDRAGGRHLYVATRVNGPRALPLPAMVTNATVSAIHGDWAVGTGKLAVPVADIEPLPAGGPPALAERVPDLEGSDRTEGRRAVSVPIRWDLRNGSVVVADPAGLARYGIDSEGLGVSADGEVFALVDRNVLGHGRWYTLPGLDSPYSPIVDSISADGTVVAGVVTYDWEERDPDLDAFEAVLTERPVVWQC